MWAAMFDKDGMKALGTALAVVAFCCTVLRRQPPGVVRLVFIIPAIILFYNLPLSLNLITVRGGVGFLLCWMANFKLLAFSANRGPLAVPGLTTTQFLALLFLPLNVGKPNQQGRASFSTWTVMLVLFIKFLGLVGLTMLLTGPDLPLVVRHSCYAAYIYLFVSIMLDSFLPLAQYALFSQHAGAPAVVLQPGMDAPLLSTSIKEFWGRRYNQLVSVILFDCVYAPIMDGRWVQQAGTAPRSGSKAVQQPYVSASTLRKATALMAVFITSGVMHELMIWYMCPNSTAQMRQQGKMLLFFVLQPPLMYAQEWLHQQLDRVMQPVMKAANKQGLGALLGLCGRVLAVLTTGGILLGCADVLFWAPFEKECRIDKVGLGEFRSGLDRLQSILGF